MTIVVLLQVIMIPFLGIFFFIKSLLKCVFFLECWNGEPINRPFMHEVVERLKILIPHLNSTSIRQKNEIISLMPCENLPSNKIETSLHGELSQIMQKFHNMSTEE